MEYKSFFNEGSDHFKYSEKYKRYKTLHDFFSPLLSKDDFLSENCQELREPTQTNRLTYKIDSLTSHLSVLKKDVRAVLKKLSSLDKDKRELLELIALDYLNSLEDATIYFPHHYDFRGRIYSKSILHFMNNKFSRVVLDSSPINYGHESFKDSKFFIKFSEACRFELLFVVEGVRIFFRKEDLSVHKILTCLYLLEIGKEEKTELLNSGTQVSLEQFALKAVKIIQDSSFESNLDILNKLNIKKFSWAILGLQSKQVRPVLLMKDATCSSLQH